MSDNLEENDYEYGPEMQEDQQEDVVYVTFSEAFNHMVSGGKASVEEFGITSTVFFTGENLYLQMTDSPFPMEIALEGEVLLSKKWVIR